MKYIIATFLSSLTLAVAAQGYVMSSDGNFVRDGSGQCVRTGTWTESNRNAACDGVSKQPVANMATLPADVLFGFDKFELTNEGKAELDKIAASLTNTELVVITGYTDQIGNSAYNQKLSERRAESVVKYLSSKTTAKFKSVGRGSSFPLPITEQCKGVRNWKQKVDCYAPNRRVEIAYVNKR
jgi:outer membrane protein OmpA-like peptidoglycan-associated protein